MPLIQALLPVSTSQPLLLSFLCMTVILPRMDRVLFIKGFEMFDMGHSMFKNFMLMEYLLHNPIVHTFVHILSDKSRSRGFKNLSYDLGVSDDRKAPHRVSRKAYNRWFVAYTLIKNPSLRKSSHPVAVSEEALRKSENVYVDKTDFTDWGNEN